jgi:PCO_ADO
MRAVTLLHLLLFCSIPVAVVGAFQSSKVAATTSNALSNLAFSMRSRDLTQCMECLKVLELSDVGSTEYISQLCRPSVSRTSPVLESQDLLISIISLPPSFTFPLHSRPGVVFSKILFGSLSLRQLDILQFVEDDDLVRSKSFEHEDAFAGDEDCVCRGGKCPRREGCIFWVNKMMRDSGSSLYASEQGSCELATGYCELIPESAGPRELINNSIYPAVLIEALLKDIDQADMIEDVPTLQYYRADRLVGAGVKGSKLKLKANDEPLGLIPMHIQWRGVKVQL